MAAGDRLSLGDPPLETELLHESERTRVTRVRLPGRTVIRKEPLGPDAERRLRHELAILERLRGVAGVVQLAEPPPELAGSIVLADCGGASLAALAKPLAVDDLIGMALALARAVAGMHGREVMHRDITPANVVISADHAPWLVDFALAARLAELRPEFAHQSRIIGTLAYLAPEQTGRTGRPVDQRADLYALGATLYELATGEPPFVSADPLRLVHDHLARVPVPPAEVNPVLPRALSDIIAHLLEKEPDRRYQTADGVAYDLERLRGARLRRDTAPVEIGAHDVSPRLLPPSRLVGREAEVAALQAAFEDALAGRCSGVLVGGAPGVGKTALVDELRSAVTVHAGWFVAGKFDAYRRDQESDALSQAVRALVRLLLAEPEDELADLRELIHAAAGQNVGLLAAMVPEFATLLGVAPDPGDPLTIPVRAPRTGADVLRAIASPHRPLVVFLDDLQWAGPGPLGVADAVLSDEPAPGLLLVAAYREEAMDPAHPLAPPLSRWRGQAAVRHLSLGNLAEPDLVTMCAEMLRVGPGSAVRLAEAIAPHTHGNPYETVELLNALYRAGALRASEDGFRWEDAALLRRLGRPEVADMLAARVKTLPPASRELVEAMAILGGQAELAVLQTALGEPADEVEQLLASVLEGGVLVVEPGVRQTVRFRHDLTREVILRGLDQRWQRSLQLTMARRLARVPEYSGIAAEQYLPVLEVVGEAAERGHVAGLLRDAAGHAKLIGDYARVNMLLAAAERLIDPGETATLAEVHTARHAALFSLGRLVEADEEYRAIAELLPSAHERAEATALQIRSLAHRKLLAEAYSLGVESLRELGVTVPAADRLPAEVDRHFDHLYRWLRHTDLADDLARGEITNPTLLAAATLLNALVPISYFASGPAATSWIGLESVRIWHEHAPSRKLLSPAVHAGQAALALRRDYAAGYQAARRVVALGDARSYEPETSDARHLCSSVSFWFEPIEVCIAANRQAWEGLIAGGELTIAAYASRGVLGMLFDTTPSLERFLAEVEAELAFARRTGNDQCREWLDSYAWLTGALGNRNTAAAGEDVLIAAASSPTKLEVELVNGSIAAAVFGDMAALPRYTAAAMPLFGGEVNYTIAQGYLLRGLALAAQARAADGDERGNYLSELDGVTQWMAARAADAPDNFLHLLRLLEAERAWAAGPFQVGALAFDAARREVAQRQRPWHQALIIEHAARFYLAYGLDVAGYELLAQARQEYLAWGATAKVDQLDWAYPTLQSQSDATDVQSGDADAALYGHRSTMTTGTIDLLGVLSASQALSSETSVTRLHTRVVQVLSAITGATGVHLLLWSEDRRDWIAPAPHSGAVPAGGAGHRQAVPMSVLRYVQRTAEPLVVTDGVSDDRFARDPYFTGLDCCSLLAVPVLSRGRLCAVLLLENRLIRGAFTAERLEAVRLITAQLAVSLDNAQVYADFVRVADEQTALQRVATLVARGAAPDVVFAAVAEEAGRLVAADIAMIGRYGPGPSVTAVVAWRADGNPNPVPLGTDVPLGGENIMSRVFSTGRPVRIEAYSRASGELAELGRASGMGSAVGVPITVEGRVWGVMMVSLQDERPWSPGTEERLAKFTELAATAIASGTAREQLRQVADEQAALRRVATLVARGVAPEVVFGAVAEEVGSLLPGVDLTSIGRYQSDRSVEYVGSWSRIGKLDWVGKTMAIGGRNVTTAVFESGQPARIDRLDDDGSPVTFYSRQGGSRSSAGAPINVEGQLWGVMIVGSAREAGLPPGIERQLAAFTELLATAIANTQAREELASSRARIVAAADQARQRMERDLHDGAQQRLVSLGVWLRAVQAAMPPEYGAKLDRAVAEAVGALDELREYARGIHPAVLTERGLGFALEALANRSPIPVDLGMRAEGRLPEHVETSAYYVVAEAMTNAAKHAQASAVSVEIETADDVVRVAVRDDGVGGAGFTGGTGLVGLKDRVEAIGGRLFLDSPPGAGTSLRAEIPLTTASTGIDSR